MYRPNVVVDGLVEYTISQLECQAQHFLRQRVDVPFRAPINVEVLLENMPGVTIRPKSNLIAQYSVEGAVCNDPETSDGRRVYIDFNLMNGFNDARYNAAVAEELAHLVLHPAMLMQVKSVEDFLEIRKCDQWKRIEVDARRFSAAIRMPESLIKESASAVYREIVDEHGFGDPLSIAKLVRNRLAQLFVVPLQDMHSRLIQWPCEVYAKVIASVVESSPVLIAPRQTAGQWSQPPLFRFDPPHAAPQ